MHSVTSNAVAAAFSALGTVVNGSITSGTYTTSSFKDEECGYINLTKGKWLVIAQIEFRASNPSAQSVVGLTLNDKWRIRVGNDNGNNDLDMQVSGILEVTQANFRASLHLLHHQTVTINNSYNYISAIKIG